MQSHHMRNGSGPRKSKVFIVDNHPMVRVRLAALIEREPSLEVCGESEAPTALGLINQCEPDLVILDTSSERSGGLDLLRKLKAQHPGVRVLVLSLDGDRLHVERALQAGANGYLTKQEAPVRILPAIQDILAGQIVNSSELPDDSKHSVGARSSSWIGGVLAVACTIAASALAQTTNLTLNDNALYCIYAQTWRQATNAGLTLITSTDLGLTWSSPMMVVTNSLGWSANHAFGVTASGRLVCIYATATIPYCSYPSNSWTNLAVIYSDDGGLTWSNGFIPNNRIWSVTNEWNYTGRFQQPIAPIPYGKIRQAGDALFAGAYESWTTDTSANYILLSTNNGVSWYPHLISFETNAATETEVLLITDKVLLAGVRHNSIDHNPTILSLSGSTDGGLTWTNLGWIPTTVAYSAQNPVGLNLFQAADGPHVFMSYGDRGDGRLYVSEAPLNQVWANPAILYSNRTAVAAISGSVNADGGYASAVNLDDNGSFLVSYYFAPYAGGYNPAASTNASIRFIEVSSTNAFSTNFSLSGSVLTNLPNQYPYEALPILATAPADTPLAATLPPVLWPIADQTLTVGMTLTLTNAAMDLGGNQLAFSLSPGAPTNALINTTNGILSWTPTRDQIGSSMFTVTVTDSSQPSRSATQSFKVTVLTNSNSSTNLAASNIYLRWNYPTNQLGSNLVFAIHHSTNLALPVAQWPVLTNVVGTNLSALISLESGQDFFVITAQDSTWGTNYQYSSQPSFQTTISLGSGN